MRSIMLKGFLVKAGYGIYVKAKKSSLTGKPIPVIQLVELGLEALSKMGIDADLGVSAKEYMAGKSTQLPVAPIVNIGSSRVVRKIGFAGKQIRYEK